MVPAQLVYKMLDEIKKGKRSVEGAAQELTKPCACGVFNPARAARLLAELSSK
jgi:hypothetical protein